MSKTNITKIKNEFRITVGQLARNHGYDSLQDFMVEECQDSVVPACCSEGCAVEPDGCCEHGCPSPLVALGWI